MPILRCVCAFIPVKWPSLVGYPFGCFLLVVCLGITLHVKWVELQLIFRSRFQFGKDDGGQKTHTHTHTRMIRLISLLRPDIVKCHVILSSNCRCSFLIIHSNVAYGRKKNVIPILIFNFFFTLQRRNLMFLCHMCGRVHQQRR